MKVKPDFEKMFIMAEAQWQTTPDPRPMPIRIDPLVLGWDGKRLWFVTAFDLTPIENYVMAEFTE